MKNNGSQQLISIQPKIIMLKQDFQVLHLLGKGAFGEVFKVLYKENQIYAMKCISKQDLQKYGKVQQAKLELEIMYSLDHENVMKLYSHYEDDDNLSLILEYISGSNLYDIMKKEGKLQEKYAIHYLRQIVNSMLYLHSQSRPILHRDIKPENILVNDQNIIKMADFGSANSMQEGELRHTFTGTTLFMAPEILENKGYDQRVDIWSLGVLMFELIAGEYPFLSEEQEKQLQNHEKNRVIVENIINIKIHFPSTFPSLARDLIRRMLKKDPNQRISFKEIQEHSWLKQAISIDAPQNKPKTNEERIKMVMSKFQFKRTQMNFGEKIVALKQQINELQVQILKGELEKQQLTEKLKELQSSDDEFSPNNNLVSPSKIVQIEDKFNKLNREILVLQKSIVDNGAFINKNQDKLEKIEHLKSKLLKQKKCIENTEKELIILSQQKKIEQQKQDEIFQTFTALNNSRSIDCNNQPNDIHLLKELVEKLKQVIQSHKNMLQNPESMIFQEEEDDYETIRDDQLDERKNQLYKDYEDAKKQLQSELLLEMRELHELEEKNQKIKFSLRDIEIKEESLRKAEEILKNLNFGYQIKQDRIKELQTQQAYNAKQLLELNAQYEHDKQQQLKMP